jgi:hypothetical protein
MSLPLRWPNKDPDESKDYQIDLAAEAYIDDGDTITGTVTWAIAPAGTLAKDTSKAGSGQTQGTTDATIWLMDGVSGQEYLVTLSGATTGGREFEVAALLLVRANSDV